LVLFYAKRCDRCRPLSEELAKVKEYFGEQISLYMVDVDDYSSKYRKKKTVPELQLWQDSEKLARLKSTRASELVLEIYDAKADFTATADKRSLVPGGARSITPNAVKRKKETTQFSMAKAIAESKQLFDSSAAELEKYLDPDRY